MDLGVAYCAARETEYLLCLLGINYRIVHLLKCLSHHNARNKQCASVYDINKNINGT